MGEERALPGLKAGARTQALPSPAGDRHTDQEPLGFLSRKEKNKSKSKKQKLEIQRAEGSFLRFNVSAFV